MNDKQWRFPGNNYGAESGLDTSDMETFKRDPISSLARELCQNSIDARVDKDKPVRMEFKLFQIQNSGIPGVDRLKKEINSCKAEWSYHEKISSQLKQMSSSINKPIIKCLRVSDFNTSGLIGVSENTNRRSAFYLLTKGSGISEKTGTTGGSKGIGKYATFVASEFNTVFYNTKTTNNEIGYQGISKLCSTKMDGSDQKTQGIGYFGNDEKNHPVLDTFSLDPNYTRNEPGTDIFILGFREEPTWIKEVISKILDSFMSAIIKDELIITVQDIILSSETMHDIVRKEDLILSKNRKDIVAQYELLTSKDIIKEEIEINGLGNATLLIKTYDRDNRKNATKQCVMVRYPYMKIKNQGNISNLPFSAMCIIGDNNLNKILRDIENPQHTNWETKRIYDTVKRREIVQTIKTLRDQISTIIIEALSSSESEETDIEGASDYLPDYDHKSSEQLQTTLTESVDIIKPKKNKVIDKIGYEEHEDAQSLKPEIGGSGEMDEDFLPKNEKPKMNDTDKPDDEPDGLDDGDADVFKYVALSGISYHFIVLDRSKGRYTIIFDGVSDEDRCEMFIYYVDESRTKYPVHIYNAQLDKSPCEVEDGTKIIFEMFKDKKYRFVLDTDQEDYFACEVKLYARR